MIRSLLVLFAFVSSLALFLPPVAAQSQDRAEARLRIESLREQIQAKERVFLAPSPEDLAAFAEFLLLPDTGLARLMPREKYDGNLLIRGGGSYYSFTRLTNEYGYGSDIELQQGRLTTGFAGADFGFLTALGDVSLESVTAEHPGVRYLAEFITPSTEPEARAQQRRAGTGFEVEGLTYRSWLPATLETTYALRAVNYGGSDVLVILRTTRQDTDGSLILVWRILRKFPVPQLGAINAAKHAAQNPGGRVTL
jgi:hypothetical protein